MSEITTKTVGQCIRCGCIEVELKNPMGIQDLSAMGESPEYPFGINCEVCVNQPLGFRSATASDGWRKGQTLGPVVRSK